jgi:hypothetical protein
VPFAPRLATRPAYTRHRELACDQQRWAAVEAVQRIPGHSRLGQTRDRIGERRGRNIGVVAAARDLLTLVFYGLRDHHIRCLPTRAAA